MFSTPSLDRLADRALLEQFGDLVRQNHLHTASLLRHIDVIDRRQLWAKYGHPSMFDFCVARHHMSESTAGKRIGAARTVKEPLARYVLSLDPAAVQVDVPQTTSIDPASQRREVAMWPPAAMNS